MYISLPLTIKNNALERTDDTRLAINRFIELLLSTPVNSVPGDFDFGFVFNNLRFEIFDESEGVVYDSNTEIVHDVDNPQSLYTKKISGTSRNVNTFASELKHTIERYEPRLRDVNVSMTYVQGTKNIFVSIRAIIRESGEEYKYNTNIKVWS